LIPANFFSWVVAQTAWAKSMAQTLKVHSKGGVASMFICDVRDKLACTASRRHMAV
jgi:hypothetical protein